MLRRKITSSLLEWKNAPERLPLLVEGARQVGKTTAVLDFAEKNYRTVYNLDFFRDPSLVSIFEGSLDPSAILTKLSVAFPEIRRTDGSTLLFLDEIQHCPKGRTALKFLAADPRFDVIASGSLPGISHPEEVSFPVGYIQRIELKPLDFEEFLWAMGIGEETLGYLAGCFGDLKPVEPFIHTSMLSYFSAYMTIGGMPAAVDSYSRFHDYSLVLGIQKDIIEGYRNDAVKYAEGSEKAKIPEPLIPLLRSCRRIIRSSSIRSLQKEPDQTAMAVRFSGLGMRVSFRSAAICRFFSFLLPVLRRTMPSRSI